MFICVGAYRGQKMVSDSLQVELQAIVSHPVWVLGLKLRSFEEQEVLLTTEYSLQSLAPYLVGVLCCFVA